MERQSAMMEMDKLRGTEAWANDKSHRFLQYLLRMAITELAGVISRAEPLTQSIRTSVAVDLTQSVPQTADHILADALS